MAAGKADGPPILIERTFPGTPLRFANDGTLFYERREQLTDAFIADLDLKSMTAAEPVPITDRAIGNNREPQLSPDGREVAFLRDSDGTATLVVRTLASGAERNLIQFNPVFGALPIQWFPGGHSLLITDRDGTRKRFRKVDARSGEASTLVNVPWRVWTGALTPDGAFLLYSLKDEENRLRLIRRRIVTGEESMMYRTTSPSQGTGLFGLSVSPDGRQIAFAQNTDNERRLMILPTAGGPPRTVLQSDRLFARGMFGWTPDGRNVIFSVQRPQEAHHLHAISTSNGELRPLGVTMQDITSRMVSRDGRRIVFTGVTSTIEVRASACPSCGREEVGFGLWAGRFRLTRRPSPSSAA